ncbi:MAG TPA: FAD-binding oxidoreductase [Thermoleophilaceae bacterium]|jgi:alkyldihydroxyacetonephosphate synthase
MAVAAERRFKFWGWGYEDQQPPADELRAAAAGIRSHLGFEPAEAELPAELDSIDLPSPQLDPPPDLSEICSTDRHERATHAQGKGYRDLIRAFRGRLDNPPDVVARPRDERELEAVLEWCDRANAAAIPFGGGTSVVGGVEPRLGGGYDGAVSIDLRALDRVLEVDDVSRAARIQAGAAGPVLEDQLRPHGLTLRHFPQSFEFSTLGGWIATRAGGHFATRLTHIDDLVESVRAIAPTGVWESRRLPGSGAGPSPDRMLIGSEGILGAITEAWVRLQDRPRFRSSASVRFATFEAGAAAVRALSQSGLEPANCRLLEGREAMVTGAAADERALLVLGFESADHPLEPWMDRALELCGDHGGEGEPSEKREGDASSQWRSAFLAAPYVRDTMIAAGVFSETFETAITWDRLDRFVSEVREVAEAKLRELAGAGTVTCRFTHVYPDGAAPYFTMLAPALRGQELDQWDAVKAAASDAVIAAGGTITHHHAVGRDHRPWYDRQRPEPFARALRVAKAELDPKGILNPGVLIDPA